MKIETRFNIDDEVYFMHENKVASAQVATVQVYSHKPYGGSVVTDTKYYLKKLGKSDGYMEDALFASKEELLNSL